MFISQMLRCSKLYLNINHTNLIVAEFALNTKLAAPPISNSLATFFTSVVKHGYMPHCLCDYILVPISKGNKDPSCSQNYRAITLGSSLSKVLEHLITNKYSSYLATSSLQFGFKSSSSTSLYTGVVKNVVSLYYSQRLLSVGVLFGRKQSI